MRVHAPRCGDHVAGCEFEKVPGDRSGPDVDRYAVRLIGIARTDGHHPTSIVNYRSDGLLTGGDRGVKLRQQVDGHQHTGQAPLVGKRRLNQRRVGALVAKLELGQLEVVKRDHRVDLDRAQIDGLAHDLAMHLALGGHVDHDVGQNNGLAAQAMSVGERPSSLVADLGGSWIG